MEKIAKISLFISLFALSGCRKETTSVVFWCSDPQYNSIGVNIDGSLAGSVNLFYSSAPDCGSPGCPTTNLRPGKYHIQAEASPGGQKWDFELKLSGKDRCLAQELQ